ncbi:MAG: hypothetical protein WCP04_04910 [Pseudomonadota bacterium]|jgi:hypothetical protein
MKFRLVLLAATLAVAACANHPPAPCSGPYEPVNPATVAVPHG